jgi:protein PhnA
MSLKYQFCPSCQSENIYQDGNLWICPECSHEWSSLNTQNSNTSSQSATEENSQLDSQIKDAFGNVLQNGDTVTVMKDLKVKGASQTIKSGTKVKNIRLQDGGDGHNISCKIDGFGAMNLKSEFVKKI